jgi:hypothetical protein
MLYIKRRPAVNYPNIPILRGRNLAHQKRSAAARALLAADWMAGRLTLEWPTAVQAAALFRVSVPYLNAARDIVGDSDKRTAVEAGTLSLFKAADVEGLAARIRRASRDEQLLAARELGAQYLWNNMVEPSLD